MSSPKKGSSRKNAPLLKRGAKVFLSSTSTDSAERRNAIIAAIESYGLECVAMERFPAGEDRPLAVCREEVAGCDALLGIVWHRYGHIPDGEEHSITELEYGEAEERGIPRLMFLVRGEAPKDPSVDLDEGKQQKLAEFKRRIANASVFKPFEGDADLVQKVHETLSAATGQKRNRSQLDPRYDQLNIYGDALLGEHRYLSMIGFGIQVRARMALDELFVPLHARLTGRADFGESGDKTVRHRSTSDEIGGEVPFAIPPDAEGGASNRATVFSAAEARAKPVVLVLGAPGSGKTSQLRRLVNSALTRDARELLGLDSGHDTRLVPIFIPLRHVRAKSVRLGLPKVLAEALPAHVDLDIEFCDWLIRERGHLLVLLDGLDEVPSELRDDVAEWVSDLARAHPTCRFVLSSRHAGYGDEERKALGEMAFEVEIQPFEAPQVEQFVRRWYAIVEQAQNPVGWEGRARDASDDLLGRLDTRRAGARRVAQMTSNPLLLTVICLIHRDRGKRLPEQRERLYREAAEVLLVRWREAKELEVPLAADDGRDLLEPVAGYLHAKEGRTSATGSELKAILDEPLRACGWEGTTEEFLLHLRDDSGILCGESSDRYRFLHLGLQEYFVARELRGRFADAAFERPEDAAALLDGLVPHFGESWWEEVLLLLFAIPEKPYLFTPFFQRLLATDPGRFAEHDDLVETAIDEGRGVSPRPFADYLRRALDADPDPDHPAVTTCLRALLLCKEPGRAALFERDLAEAIVRRANENWAEEITRLAEQHEPELGRRLRGLLAERGSVTVRPEPALLRLAGNAPSVVARQVHAVSGVELVQVQGTDFDMGGTKHSDEEPIHRVTVEPFRLARTPVTNEQYARFLEARPDHPKPKYWNDRRYNGDTQPVVGVSWDDAQAYCEWADLRLPSEAEWEYACRAGTTTEYWFGDDGEKMAEFGWFEGNSGRKLRAVGQKPASPYGLHDMHGNVWEWCQDLWHGSYKGAPNDGSAWEEGGSRFRVIRGGSFGDSAGYARSAYRLSWHPGSRDGDLGFRPAADLP